MIVTFTSSLIPMILFLTFNSNVYILLFINLDFYSFSKKIIIQLLYQ